MTALRSAVISAILAVAVLGALWIANDDRFGRPGARAERDRQSEMWTVPPLPYVEMFTATFPLCEGPIRKNCVVDGDTIWFRGDKIRIADIDAPEISSPNCEDEKVVGEIARDRLVELLNAGGFSLRSGWRDTDRYGRMLRTVTRKEKSLGEMLVEEGLAQRWNAPRRDWCMRD